MRSTPGPKGSQTGPSNPAAELSALPPLDLLVAGQFDPAVLLTRYEPATGVVEVHLEPDRRERGWLKTVLATG